MNIRTTFFLFAILGLLPVAPLFAAQNLFSVEVPVVDRGPEARKDSIRQAFEEVLVKASGHRNLMGRSGMDELLLHAENYVQQFRYRVEALDTPEQAEKRWIWVAFEHKAVQKALRELGLDVWEKGRPKVLVWLAKEENGYRALINPEQNAPLFQTLREAAAKRGLSLLLPIMDLQDQSAVRVSDIWTNDKTSLVQASLRYGDHPILAGRIQFSGKQWIAKWTLYLPDRQQQFSITADGAEMALASSVNKVMDFLADQYVPTIGDEEADLVALKIQGIGSSREYLRLMRLLESLDVITNLSIQEAVSDELLIKVQVRGGRDILRQRLSLESSLQLVAGIPGDEGGDPTGMPLVYRIY